jgi:hypothetical protein
VEKTKICVSCFKPMPGAAKICPRCGTEQPGPGQEKAMARRIARVRTLRLVYGVIIVSVSVFLAVQLWENRGKKVTPEEQCKTAKSYGFSGTLEDCIKQMSK